MTNPGLLPKVTITRPPAFWKAHGVQSPIKVTVMIAWINLIVMIASAFLMLYFYVKSVSPAALEKKIGDSAYARCKR